MKNNNTSSHKKVHESKKQKKIKINSDENLVIQIK